MVNGAVPGGDLEEAICMYELACESGRRPKRILLEVHGWGTMLGKRRSVLIHDFHPIHLRVLKELRLNTSESRRPGHPVAGHNASGSVPGVTGEKGWFDPYDKLISPRYLQLAIKTLIARYASGMGTSTRSLLRPRATSFIPTARHSGRQPCGSPLRRAFVKSTARRPLSLPTWRNCRWTVHGAAPLRHSSTG